MDLRAGIHVGRYTWYVILIECPSASFFMWKPHSLHYRYPTLSSKIQVYPYNDGVTQIARDVQLMKQSLIEAEMAVTFLTKELTVHVQWLTPCSSLLEVVCPMLLWIQQNVCDKFNISDLGKLTGGGGGGGGGGALQ